MYKGSDQFIASHTILEGNKQSQVMVIKIQGFIL